MIDPAALASLFFEASKEWREPKIAWANVNRLRLLERDGWMPVAERDLVVRINYQMFFLWVTGTMVVTACMAFLVIWKVWNWSPLLAGALMAPFLVIDTTFLTANLLKVVEGGWVPLAFAAAVSMLMYTWQEGTRVLFEKTRKLETPLDSLVAMLEKKPPPRVHRRSSPTRPRPPTPIGSEPSTVPANDRLRSDDRQGISKVRKQSIEADSLFGAVRRRTMN